MKRYILAALLALSWVGAYAGGNSCWADFVTANNDVVTVNLYSIESISYDAKKPSRVWVRVGGNSYGVFVPSLEAAQTFVRELEMARSQCN